MIAPFFQNRMSTAKRYVWHCVNLIFSAILKLKLVAIIAQFRTGAL